MIQTLIVVTLLAAAPLKLPFPIPDADGVSHLEGELQERALTAFVFLSLECPICNRSIPDLGTLAARYTDQVRFFAVNPEPSATAEQVKRHDRDYQLGFVTLLDPQQVLAKALGATTTPTVVVVSKDHQVLYRGRIDDRVVELGKTRSRPRREDLRVAIDEALAGKQVSVPETAPIGCAIEGAHR